MQAFLKTVIGEEGSCLLCLPNMLWLGIFASSLMSALLQGRNVSLFAFSPFQPCGSHVAVLYYAGVSQQGPWKERNI